MLLKYRKSNEVGNQLCANVTRATHKIYRMFGFYPAPPPFRGHEIFATPGADSKFFRIDFISPPPHA